MIHTKFKKKGTCVGPLGFPMRETAARALEPKLRSLEKDGLTYQRQFVTTKDVELEDGERADISVITASTVDRENEVILANGADLRGFQENPVITWGHDYSLPPVGRAMWLKYEPNKRTATHIKAKIEYAPRPEEFEGTWFADVVWHLVKGEFLKGKSIGFLPLEIGPPTQKEIDKQPELQHVKTIYRSWRLFEVAVATVPCNPDALVDSVAKGQIELPDDILKSLGLDTVVECGDCWVWDGADEVPMPTYSRSLTKLLS